MYGDINRFWFSKEQERFQLKTADSSNCEVFVNGKWVKFTQWTTSVFGKSNWRDAVLVAESHIDLPVRVNGVVQ